jgi:hypothetical protein
MAWGTYMLRSSFVHNASGGPADVSRAKLLKKLDQNFYFMNKIKKNEKMINHSPGSYVLTK